MSTTTRPLQRHKDRNRIHCRSQLTSPRGEVISRDDDETESGTPKKGIRCIHCGALITSAEHRAIIEGKHEHAFFNPAGIIFEIQCFHQAVGVYPRGPTSTEFSWFKECAWQVVLCRGCHIHLGWKFNGRQNLFYGLIGKHLSEQNNSN